ncbi:hypothetical protein COP2_040201 [Malus domestica]
MIATTICFCLLLSRPVKILLSILNLSPGCWVKLRMTAQSNKAVSWPTVGFAHGGLFQLSPRLLSILKLSHEDWLALKACKNSYFRCQTGSVFLLGVKGSSENQKQQRDSRLC